MTTTIREELHIDCPPTAAFDLMADVRRITDWNSGVSSVEMKSNRAIGRGSRFVAVTGSGDGVDHHAVDRPERLEFATTGKTMDVAGRFSFKSAGSGTRLIIELDPRLKGS